MQNKKNYPASCGGRPGLEKSSYSRETHPRMSRETRLRKLDLLSSSTVEASVVGCVGVGADDDDGVGAGIGSSLPPCFRFSSRSFSWRKSSSGLPASGWPSFCWGKFKKVGDASFCCIRFQCLKKLIWQFKRISCSDFLVTYLLLLGRLKANSWKFDYRLK